MKPVVSIVKYEGLNSVAEVISMCDGFSALKPEHRVLLKPNICTDQAGFFPLHKGDPEDRDASP